MKRQGGIRGETVRRNGKGAPRWSRLEAELKGLIQGEDQKPRNWRTSNSIGQLQEKLWRAQRVWGCGLPPGHLDLTLQKWDGSRGGSGVGAATEKPSC